MKKLLFLLLTAVLCIAAAPVFAGETPVEIASRQALEAIADNPYGQYVLTADIDMAGSDWTPIEFYGSLDGNGHTICNLHITQVGEKKARTRDGNLNKYDTYFASLFSVVKDAEIKNLHLLGVQIYAETKSINCFAAGLAGLAENTIISGCSVSGRIYLSQNRYMCGVAGIAGSGSGTISNCSADVELVIVDTNRSIKCEQFLGGIAGAGYFDIENCAVVLDGYASVHGYVHNGGIIGMWKIYMTDDREHIGYVCGCSVDARITFFEHNRDRRAYCAAVIGEKLNVNLTPENNTVISFESTETQDYNTVLLPEQCEKPLYTETVIPPAESRFGYTLHSCQTCGYTYKDRYVPPADAE